MEYIFIALLTSGSISERVHSQLDCETLSVSIKFIDKNALYVCVEVEKRKEK